MFKVKYEMSYRLNFAYCNGHFGITRHFKTLNEAMESFHTAKTDLDNTDFVIDIVEKIKRPFKKVEIITTRIFEYDNY